MIKRFLPLVSLPKLTVPLISAIIAWSFGRRASNKSATRGRPPVISLVPDDSCGTRPKIEPVVTSSPSRTRMMVCCGKKYTTSLPSLVSRIIAGRKSLPELGRSLVAKISYELIPVASSIFMVAVKPSVISLKRAVPDTSVIIGWVCGSHLPIV